MLELRIIRKSWVQGKCPRDDDRGAPTGPHFFLKWIFIFVIGSILGFIAGAVGIGGGIFLSPMLFLMRAGKPKHIVTSASLFILINSLSGIIGQLTKNIVLSEIQNYWFLLLAVLIGGQIGNFLNLKIFPTRILALVTAGLVLFVAIRMAYKLFI